MKKKNERIKLMLPSPEMKNRAFSFRDAFSRNGENHIHGGAGLQQSENFDNWLAVARGFELPDNWLPSTTFFAVRIADNTIVGTANIRHCLDEARYHNGHIGYSVRPDERGKGYGKEILRLALIKAEQLGVLEPVVSCEKDNIASKSVIEGNGLTFKREFTDDGGNAIRIYVKEPGSVSRMRS